MPLLLLACGSREARADEGGKQACVDAHIEGQRLRDAGKLKAARQQFLACSVETCPAPLRKECLEWQAATEASMPTVLIHARRADGQDTADVSVLVDGENVLGRLTGMPLSVDPGEHVLRFVSKDGSTREERVVLSSGEKNRRVEVAFSASPSKPPDAVAPTGPSSSSPSPSTSSGVPTSAYVLGAVGIVAVGSFAFFGVQALTRGSDLKDTCAPDCSSSASSVVHRDALVADVSLGVGILALGAATWILLTHRASTSASAILAAPTAQGFVGGWRARF